MNTHIDKNNFSIKFLDGEDREYLLKQTNLYLEKLDIKTNDEINKLQFIQLWNGYGTVNTHNIPIMPNIDIISFINTIYEIYNVIEEDTTVLINMRKEYEIKKDKLILLKDNKMKIFSIIAYLLIYQPSKEKAIYTLGMYMTHLFLEGDDK